MTNRVTLTWLGFSPSLPALYKKNWLASTISSHGV